jgi:outer membrane protein TolC
MKLYLPLAGLAALPILLSACAFYEPLPLESKPHLVTSLPTDVDNGKPLTMADITRLTLKLNPDLQAARNDRQIASAHIIQAGILPNPQFGGSYGFLLSGPAMFDSYGLGLSEDIKALIVRGAAQDSAEFDAHKVDADLLWQEWQTISKAQLLDVDLVEMQKQREIMEQERQLLADHHAKSHQALLSGNLDLTVEAPDLTALSDITKQLADLDRQVQTKWQELDALLGLEPSVRFELSADVPVAPIDSIKARETLSELPKIRPDLIALQYGYQSQEEKLRGAILGQFPALVFGGTYGPDTSHVYSGGPTITLDLPIFNRSQGNIAIETATRQKLHDDYTNRLNSADGEAKAILDSRALLHEQYDRMQKTLPEAQANATDAERAFQAGNIDERTYVDLKIAYFNQQLQAIALKQSLLEKQIALATLMGVNMPVLKPLSSEEKP